MFEYQAKLCKYCTACFYFFLSTLWYAAMCQPMGLPHRQYIFLHILSLTTLGPLQIQNRQRIRSSQAPSFSHYQLPEIVLICRQRHPKSLPGFPYSKLQKYVPYSALKWETTNSATCYKWSRRTISKSSASRVPLSLQLTATTRSSANCKKITIENAFQNCTLWKHFGLLTGGALYYKRYVINVLQIHVTLVSPKSGSIINPVHDSLVYLVW